MKFNFLESENIRKIYIIRNLFSGMPEHMVACPSIFGNRFLNGYDIYKELKKPDPTTSNHKKAEMQLVNALLKVDGIDAYLSSVGKSDLIKKLDAFKLPVIRDSLEPVEASMTSRFSMYKNRIDKCFCDIFGIEPPEAVNIVLCEGFNEDWVKGQMLSTNPITIGISVYTDIDNMLMVMLHELLHALLYRENMINYSAQKGAGAFEEILLRYFVPHGLLAARLGIKNTGIEIAKEEAMRVEPNITATLFNAIKTYDEAGQGETIWKHLKDTQFSHLINYPNGTIL